MTSPAGQYRPFASDRYPEGWKRYKGAIEPDDNNLTAPQRELHDLMSSVSELAWSAGWMRGLEYELWKAVQSPPYKVGRLQLSPTQCDRLTAAASAALASIVVLGGQLSLFAMISNDASATLAKANRTTPALQVVTTSGSHARRG